MGYRLNRLNEPVLMAVPKPMQTEFDIHHRLESCAANFSMTSITRDVYSLDISEVTRGTKNIGIQHIRAFSSSRRKILEIVSRY